VAEDLSYDAREDRVFVINRFGHSGVIDRVTMRAEQNTAWLFIRRGDPEGERVGIEQTAVLWEPRTARLFILSPALGRIEAIAPK
jgi:hypothetical protein